VSGRARPGSRLDRELIVLAATKLAEALFPDCTVSDRGGSQEKTTESELRNIPRGIPGAEAILDRMHVNSSTTLALLSKEAEKSQNRGPRGIRPGDNGTRQLAMLNINKREIVLYRPAASERAGFSVVPANRERSISGYSRLTHLRYSRGNLAYE